MDPELKRVLQGIVDRQMAQQRLVENVGLEQATMRTDIRELRREVGLSLPPAGLIGDAQAKRGFVLHARASFRYGLVAAAGAAGAVLADWLAKLVGGAP